MDVIAYTYQAEILCPDCIIGQLPSDVLSPAAHDMRAEDVLDQVAAYVGIDRYDEYTYDSDEFPKVVLSSQIDSAETCGACGGDF